MQESLKPCFQSGNEMSIETSKEMLYTCLETGLRLLCPFMPFVTEELYQRLPRRKSDTAKSITVAEYPLPEKVWFHKKTTLRSIYYV